MEQIRQLENDCYEELVNAIIIQAAEDYRTAWKRVKKGDDRALYHIKEIEAFFKSAWGDFLCGKAHATDILKRLQKEQGVK